MGTDSAPFGSTTKDSSDDAFIDRADIVQYIGLPSQDAVYEILRSCLLELMRTGIVEQLEVPSATAAKQPPTADILAAQEDLRRSVMVGSRLETMALRSQRLEMSGRSLRRLPVLAHARYIGLGLQPEQVATNAPVAMNGAGASRKTPVVSVRRTNPCPVELWLDAMDRVVASREVDRGRDAV